MLEIQNIKRNVLICIGIGLIMIILYNYCTANFLSITVFETNTNAEKKWPVPGEQLKKSSFSTTNEDIALSLSTLVAKAENPTATTRNEDIALSLSTLVAKAENPTATTRNEDIALSLSTLVAKAENPTATTRNEDVALSSPTLTVKTDDQISVINQIELTTMSYEPEHETLEEMLKEALRKAQDKEYMIIIWDPPFGWKEDIKLDSANCGRCKVIYDRSKSEDPSTKAIVFHFREINTSNWPKKRRSDQLYAWWCRESSQTVKTNYGQSLAQFDDVFNLTMTYRRDSDVLSAYRLSSDIWKQFQTSESGDPAKDIDDLVENKKKLAVWIVSNCGYTIGARTRMAYIKKLKNIGLQVDLRGKCFPQNGAVSNMEIIKQYKFYLAFENSYHCKDYITEKLFRNGLSIGAVPVVWGAPKSDYEAVVPPGSCIYVDDFKSPEQLIEYLNYLDKNTTAYKQYLNWRTMKVEDIPQYNRTNRFCNLCRILHGINVDNIYKPQINDSGRNIPTFDYPGHPRIVSSLQKWFYGAENRECVAKY